MKMKQKFPDYSNCIVNLANSILSEFGCNKEGRQTLKTVDSYLAKGYENIVVILLDGMGKCIVKRNFEKDGFFNTHLKSAYSSVFPPTTVAATTSVLSGLTPCEHSWLGWDCYYPDIDKNVTVFSNNESGTDNSAADYNVAWKFCGYENVGSKIRANGGNAYEVAPFLPPFPDSFEKICGQIKTLCDKMGKKYIYGYWNEPDNIMHRKGCYSAEAKQMMKTLEKQVQHLCDELENTLVIVTADHGHMDSRTVSITDYPKITECLVRMPSIEPRALNLFIQEEKKEQFEHEFMKEFGKKFLLWTKEQVLDSKIFGNGTEHPYFEKMLGDYLAIAIDDLSIFNSTEEADSFIGVHAGLTEDEMEIPLIIIEK
ncbi:MAG: PglZ domain-containing protein [Lachnospiraceae bacterium]|nr:PglZ domain-containing protein [Lachnospiraceae bacterium]